MKNLIKHKEGESSMITWTKKRIKNNLNFLPIWTGATGIGKTWSAISFSYDLDSNFNAEKQIVFSFKALMELITSDWFKNLKMKIVIFDEPQTQISNKDWQSRTNKMFNFVLSTFRHENIILNFCTPYRDFLDSASMKLVHCEFECQGVNRKKQLSHIRPKLLQYNPTLKKFYRHSLHVIRNRKVHKMKDWFVKKPPKHLTDVFEARKTEFTDKLNANILQELTQLEAPKQIGFRKELTERQQEVLDLMNELGNVDNVAEKLKISSPSVYAHLKLIKNKGYMPTRPKKKENNYKII